MADLRYLAEQIEGLNDGPKVLRFSECKTRYQWASVQTDSVAIMRLLCAMWNARREIAQLIRQEVE